MKASVFLSLLLLGCYQSPSHLRSRSDRSGIIRAITAAQTGQQDLWDTVRPFSTLVHLGCVTLSPLVNRSDQEILRQLRRGDLRALESLYRSYERTIFSLGHRLCGSAENADDVLQDTFLEVNRSFRLFRGDGSLLAWIKKICVNKALMRMRQENRFSQDLLEDCEQWPPAAAPLYAVHFSSGSPGRDLEQALQKLNSTARIVVWLHDVEGYTHEEIAALLHKTESFSKSQLSRAHARLREWLGEAEEDPACGI